MIDLNAWLDANNPTEGAKWTLDYAFDINDAGLITGLGMYNDSPSGTAFERAFILDASNIVDPLPGDADFDADVDLADLGKLGPGVA
jgi:hypothetical protein